MIKNLFAPKYNVFRPAYWFGQVDSRSLSVFRILFGALMLKDALYHIPLAGPLYSDSGVVPRIGLLGALARPERFSLMDSFPYEWMATAFFAIWAAVALGLILGYRTKFMTILNFVLILSVHERNFLVLNGADTVMRVLSLWIIFLPLGHHYSIDAVTRRWSRFQRSRQVDDLRVEEAPRTTFAFPLRMLQIQVALVYLFTAILKIPGDSWASGDALQYALQLQTLTLPSGEWFLRASPDWVLAVSSYFTLVAEWAFIFLVFSPVGQPTFRILGLAFAGALHLGIAVFMSIPNFSIVLMISFLAFFEAGWVEGLDRASRCQRGRSLIPPAAGAHPLLPVLAVTTASELSLASGDPVDYSDADGWWIEDERGERRFGELAWLRLAGHLPLSRLWAWVLRYRPTRNLVWFGLRQTAQQRVEPQPQPAPATSAAVGTAGRLFTRAWKLGLVVLLATMMSSVVWTNLRSVTKGGEPLVTSLPHIQQSLVQYTGLWQAWNMFSPDPRNYDGWIVIPGKFEDGAGFELRSGAPLGDHAPRGTWGPSARWKTMESRLWRGVQDPILLAWASGFCNKLNEQEARPEGQRLATLEIHLRWRRSHDPGVDPNQTQDLMLWKHWCSDEYRY